MCTGLDARLFSNASNPGGSARPVSRGLGGFTAGREAEAEDLVTSGRWHFLTLGTSRGRRAAGGNQKGFKLSARVPCAKKNNQQQQQQKKHSTTRVVTAPKRAALLSCGLIVYMLSRSRQRRRACAFECAYVGRSCSVSGKSKPST